MHFMPLGADFTPPDGPETNRSPQDIAARGVKCIPRKIFSLQKLFVRE